MRVQDGVLSERFCKFTWLSGAYSTYQSRNCCRVVTLPTMFVTNVIIVSLVGFVMTMFGRMSSGSTRTPTTKPRYVVVLFASVAETRTR